LQKGDEGRNELRPYRIPTDVYEINRRPLRVIRQLLLP
jgi:hypothetical protein